MRITLVQQSMRKNEHPKLKMKKTQLIIISLKRKSRTQRKKKKPHGFL